MSSSIIHNNTLKFALILCWAATALIGYKGFFQTNELLSVPLLELQIPSFISYSSAILLFSLPVIAVFSKPVLGKYLYGIAIVAYLVICIDDVHRVTPYMFVYLSIFACFIFIKNDRHIFYTALVFVLSGIYIFSGLHKFNEGFVNDIAPYFYFHSIPISYNVQIGYTMAITEFTLGILLLFKSTRKAAAVVLIAMHLIIMWKLSPWKLGWNYIVIPWNLIMIFCHSHVLRKSDKSRFKIGSGRPVFIGLAIFIWIIPGVSQVAALPENISLKMYSGKSIAGYISFTSKEAIFKQYDRSTEKKYLLMSLQQYSMEERGIAFNPELEHYNLVFLRFREKFSSTHQLHHEKIADILNTLP